MSEYPDDWPREPDPFCVLCRRPRQLVGWGVTARQQGLCRTCSTALSHLTPRDEADLYRMLGKARLTCARIELALERQARKARVDAAVGSSTVGSR